MPTNRSPDVDTVTLTQESFDVDLISQVRELDMDEVHRAVADQSGAA